MSPDRQGTEDNRVKESTFDFVLCGHTVELDLRLDAPLEVEPSIDCQGLSSRPLE